MRRGWNKKAYMVIETIACEPQGALLQVTDISSVVMLGVDRISDNVWIVVGSVLVRTAPISSPSQFLGSFVVFNGFKIQ